MTVLIVELHASITSVDESQFPFVVSLEFHDHQDVLHLVHEKVPVLALELEQHPASRPQVHMIQCEAIDFLEDGVLIDLSKPHGYETAEGVCQLVVAKDQVRFP